MLTSGVQQRKLLLSSMGGGARPTSCHAPALGDWEQMWLRSHTPMRASDAGSDGEVASRTVWKEASVRGGGRLFVPWMVSSAGDVVTAAEADPRPSVKGPPIVSRDASNQDRGQSDGRLKRETQSWPCFWVALSFVAGAGVVAVVTPSRSFTDGPSSTNFRALLCSTCTVATTQLTGVVSWSPPSRFYFHADSQVAVKLRTDGLCPVCRILQALDTMHAIQPRTKLEPPTPMQTSQTTSLHRPLAYRLLELFNKNVPTSPAATAMPPTTAAPMSPSLVTLSSINSFKLPACRLAGSFSKSSSLYRRASA